MALPQASLPPALIEDLQKAAGKTGQLSVADASRVIAASAWYRESVLVRREMQDIAAKIIEAEEETRAMTQKSQKNGDIQNATLELDAVLKTTEDAANKILDAADHLQTAISQTALKANAKVNDALTEIVTACNFQDLSGQRISKVISVLRYIEPKIKRLYALFNEGAPPAPQALVKAANGKASLDERDLLNGPQLGSNAPSQDDVDALFKKS